MKWRAMIVWGSTLACAALTWATTNTLPSSLCLIWLAAMGAHSLTGVLYDGLARARERARLRGKVKAGALDEADLPAPLIKFPILAFLTAFLSCFSAFAVLMLLELSPMTRPMLDILCVGSALLSVFATLYAVGRLSLWLVNQSGETAFTAAEALRRRKLKETIYAESDDEPLDVSDLQGDVSVGDDGELLDKPKREADDS
jgi:hypothetical protein